jgi:hypothetical protein
MDKLPKRKKIIGWKKLQDQLIAELEIPATAKRVLCYGPERKCRAEKVKVLSIHIGDAFARKWNIDHGQNNEVNGGISCFSKKIAYYEVGKFVEADMYDPSPTTQCSHGINFFLTREEAENYAPL